MEPAYQAYCDTVWSLRGHTLARVAYYSWFIDGEPGWSGPSNAFDLVNPGIELRTVAGAQFAITWDWTFACYGLVLAPGSMRQFVVPDAEVAVWDVSATPRWAPLLGAVIDTANIYWAWNWTTESGAHVKVPYVYEVGVAAGSRLFLLAADYVPERDGLFPMTDSVVVISDERIAERYQIGPYGDDSLLA